jgi:hypothetical protein
MTAYCADLPLWSDEFSRDFLTREMQIPHALFPRYLVTSTAEARDPASYYFARALEGMAVELGGEFNLSYRDLQDFLEILANRFELDPTPVTRDVMRQAMEIYTA